MPIGISLIDGVRRYFFPIRRQTAWEGVFLPAFLFYLPGNAPFTTVNLLILLKHPLLIPFSDSSAFRLTEEIFRKVTGLPTQTPKTDSEIFLHFWWSVFPRRFPAYCKALCGTHKISRQGKEA